MMFQEILLDPFLDLRHTQNWNKQHVNTHAHTHPSIRDIQKKSGALIICCHHHNAVFPFYPRFFQTRVVPLRTLGSYIAILLFYKQEKESSTTIHTPPTSKTIMKLQMIPSTTSSLFVMLLSSIPGRVFCHEVRSEDFEWSVSKATLPKPLSDHSATFSESRRKVYLAGGCGT
jgi:hypothetical protein